MYSGPMRRPWVLLLVSLGACTPTGAAEADRAREACEATYRDLEALGCVDALKSMRGRGCFLEAELQPDGCEREALEPCNARIDAFAEEPDGWWAPLEVFLDRHCGPEGTRTVEWPEPDLAALRAAKQAKEAAEAAKAAEEAAKAAVAAEREALEQELAKQAKAEKFAIARVVLGQPTIQGPLSKKALRRVVNDDLDTMRECYAEGLVRDETDQGEVTIQFVITSTGKVGASVVQTRTIHDNGAANCMAKAVKKWRFDDPDHVGNILVSLPFELRTKS